MVICASFGNSFGSGSGRVGFEDVYNFDSQKLGEGRFALDENMGPEESEELVCFFSRAIVFRSILSSALSHTYLACYVAEYPVVDMKDYLTSHNRFYEPTQEPTTKDFVQSVVGHLANLYRDLDTPCDHTNFASYKHVTVSEYPILQAVEAPPAQGTCMKFFFNIFVIQLIS